MTIEKQFLDYAFSEYPKNATLHFKSIPYLNLLGCSPQTTIESSQFESLPAEWCKVDGIIIELLLQNVLDKTSNTAWEWKALPCECGDF